MRRRGAAGVTLVEVVVALLLLAVGALALAGGIASSERARRSALAEGLALSAAEGWLEAWRATPWDSLAATGDEPLEWGPWEGRLEWSVTPLGPCLAEAAVAAVVLQRRVALATRRFREGESGCGG
ncbi:MAG TPA: prepilin-type N-terminal cleavage/methylation domain-containing protein [Gemmatimonadota bacterium]|nr:prepilin-type N-terminal cleavage/methylation domain-containing protein [Gemmatimonadota bacterium]